MPRHKQPVTPAVRAKHSKVAAKALHVIREETRHAATREDRILKTQRMTRALSGKYTFGLPPMPEPLPPRVRVIESTAHVVALSGPAWPGFERHGRAYLGIYLIPRRAP